MVDLCPGRLNQEDKGGLDWPLVATPHLVLLVTHPIAFLLGASPRSDCGGVTVSMGIYTILKPDFERFQGCFDVN